MASSNRPNGITGRNHAVNSNQWTDFCNSTAINHIRMKKIIPILTVLLFVLSPAYGQTISPDTLTIYGTFTVHGRSPEWIEDQLNVWKPDIYSIRKDSDKVPFGEEFVLFKCHDIHPCHKKDKEALHPDQLFFDLYVKCMPDSCTIYMTNIDVIRNSRPVRYIYMMSTYDGRLNRSSAWLRKYKELADSARVYSLSLFYELKESLEKHLNRPEEVKLRRIQ